MKLFKVIKHIVADCLRLLFRLMPLRKVILFESYPDYSGNTFKVYKELCDRKYNLKYKFVWFTQSKEKNKNFISTNSFLKRLYYEYVSRFILCENRFIYKKRKKQTSIYITHGNPCKDVKDYYFLKGTISYMICLAPFYEQINAEILRFDPTKTFGLGHPRNDDLLLNNVDLKSVFGPYDKFIFWYPTVKEFRSGRIAGNSLPVSFFDKKSNIIKINETASEHNVLIVIKLHFAQKESLIAEMRLSNIVFIDNGFLNEHCLSNYQLLGQSDALITDYSSVFYDYLILDKPICFVWEDFELYKNKPGVVDMFVNTTSACGDKVYTIDELCNFIKNVANNIDKRYIERQEVIKLTYPYNEKKSTNRVTDFVIDKFGLKKG